MKIKVDKKEYEQLLARVERLEQYMNDSFERSRLLEIHFRDYIESYFTDKCRVVMMKRDKDAIVAELRSQVMDNLFKEQEEE